MTFVTITFTFPSPDVVFLPAQLWWHSLGSCQHPLVPSPRAGAPAAGKVPHTIPIPHSSIPASAPGRAQPLLHCLSPQQFVPSTRQLYLPAAQHRVCTGLERTRQACGSNTLLGGGGEGRELQRGPGANLSPFIPASSPLLHHLGSTQHQACKKNKACGSCSARPPLAERAGGGDVSSPPRSLNPSWVA